MRLIHICEIRCPVFPNCNKEKWNFLNAGSNTVDGFENSEFFFSICYIGSGTSQTNDLKKANYDQALTHLVSAFLVLLTTISLQVFFDVSSLYTHYIAFHALVSLIGHSFWEPVEPTFWPKKTEMVLHHSYAQKNCYYWDSIRKYEYEAGNAMWTKNLE